MKGGAHARFGGVKFRNNAPVEEINKFVRGLRAEERESLFEVLTRLQSEGLITIDDEDITTIDRSMQPFLE